MKRLWSRLTGPLRGTPGTAANKRCIQGTLAAVSLSAADAPLTSTNAGVFPQQVAVETSSDPFSGHVAGAESPPAGRCLTRCCEQILASKVDEVKNVSSLTPGHEARVEPRTRPRSDFTDPNFDCPSISALPRQSEDAGSRIISSSCINMSWRRATDY
ncbi:uncharacterized protein V6R79_011667 [Siganus canaliculatus]